MQPFVEKLIENLSYYETFVGKADRSSDDEDVISVFREIIDFLKSEIEPVFEPDKQITLNYLHVYHSNVHNINKAVAKHPIAINSEGQILDLERYRQESIRNLGNIQHHFDRLKFNHFFLKSLNYFKGTIVAVGANGSGKTSLTKKLKEFQPNGMLVISAQKVLVIPTLNTFQSATDALKNLEDQRNLSVTVKDQFKSGSFHSLTQKFMTEFEVLLSYLIAERIKERNQFVENDIHVGLEVKFKPVGKLDVAIQIWNELIVHRNLFVSDDFNLMVNQAGFNSYSANQMSDGEKVILFYVAQVLCADKNGIIIIDEPEIYLHKLVTNKLWNRLERERDDCVFIYLTHDLNFASSRLNSQKLWIKSFVHPDNWEIEEIVENEIPSELFMELLGTQKDILFCESRKQKIDQTVYNILFPNYNVIPVDGCSDVIRFTKALNKLEYFPFKAYGIIDRDFRSNEELNSLKVNSIFPLGLAELENIFLDKNFLLEIASKYGKDEKDVEVITAQIFKQLKASVKTQTANYVVNEIHYMIKESHIENSSSLDNVKKNFSDFISRIEIENWHSIRENELLDIIKFKDYQKAIEVFNNKGLSSIVKRVFKAENFDQDKIEVLRSDNGKYRNHVLKFFPDELKNHP